MAIEEESSVCLKSHERDIHSQNSTMEQLLPSYTSRATTRIDWYNMTEGNDSNIQEWFGYGGGPKVELQFNGDLLRVSPAFGCCLTNKLCISKSMEVPEQLKVFLYLHYKSNLFDNSMRMFCVLLLVTYTVMLSFCAYYTYILSTVVILEFRHVR